MNCPSLKISHPSKGKAQAALRALVKVKPGYSGRAYPCAECRGWHIGRLKANAHVNRYAR